MPNGKRKKVGLALGGGAARGMAHIGVLEVLQKEGIPIDMIAGTSAGALIGALYAKELDANLIKQQVLALDWKQLTRLADLTLPKSGFIAGRRITGLLKEFLGGNIEFGDLNIPFACVATDIYTADEVIIKEGSVVEAVRASIAVPVIFTTVKWQNRYLVDGGLINQVPVSVVKEMGADFIIAVNVIPDRADRAKFIADNRKEYKEPNIFTVIIQSIYISEDLNVRAVSAGAAVVIHPHLAHINPGEFHRAPECILAGELAAEACIMDIIRPLGLTGKPV
jgi:NTE family protein